MGSLFKVMYGADQPVLVHWSLTLCAIKCAIKLAERSIDVQFAPLRRILQLVNVKLIFNFLKFETFLIKNRFLYVFIYDLKS